MTQQVEIVYGAFTGRITLDIQQDITTNKSTVSVSAIEVKTTSGATDICYVDGTIKVAGTQVIQLKLDSVGGCTCTLKGSSWATVNLSYVTASSTTITHDSDGSKTVSVASALTIRKTSGGTVLGGVTGTQDAVLPTIARASTVAVSPNPVTMGGKLGITLTRAVSTFNHKVYYSIGSKVKVNIANNVGTTYSWTVPDLTGELGGKTTGVMTIICDTYNGSTLIGSSTTTVNVAAPGASTISLNASSVEMGGGTVVISVSRASNNYTHKLYYKVGSNSRLLMASDVGTSYTWTVPDMASLLGTATSATCEIACETYLGTALIGSSSKSITLTASGASSITLPSGEIPIGSTAAITITRKSTSYTHKLLYSIGSSTTKTEIASNVVTGYSWVIPDLSAKIGSALSATVTITCETYNGSTKIGTKTGTMTVTCPGASGVSANPVQVEMGSGSVIISIDRSYGSYTHNIYYSIGSKNKVQIATGVTNSTTWAVPDLASEVSGASGNCTITCDTYSGSTKMGSSTTTVTLIVPGGDIITGDMDMICGTAFTIQCKRPSTAYTVRIEYSFHGASGLIGEGKFDSRSWTPPYDLAKQIPDMVKSVGTITFIVKNGTAEVSRDTATFTLTVPENATTRPSFSASGLTISRVTSLTGELGKLWIRGRTGLRAAFSASSTYSTIKDYSITLGTSGANGNPAVIDLIADEGIVAYTAKVTDARGFSTSVTGTINVMPYRAPKIVPYSGNDTVICERAKANGELSSEGTYLAIRAGRSYSSLVSGNTELNKCVLRYRWRTTGGSWSSWVTLIEEDTAANQISTLIAGIVTSDEASYEVELSALDSVGAEHLSIFQIGTSAISFVLYDGEDGAGFGKYPEEPHVVDIAAHMTLHVRGKMIVDGQGWQDLGLAAQISESSYAYGRTDGCGYRVENGRHIYIAVCGAFSFNGGVMAMNARAIPEEYRPARTVFAICPASSHSAAVVSVSPDGFIRVEAVQDLTAGVATNAASVAWVDGYTDYFV